MNQEIGNKREIYEGNQIFITTIHNSEDDGRLTKIDAKKNAIEVNGTRYLLGDICEKIEIKQDDHGKNFLEMIV